MSGLQRRLPSPRACRWAAIFHVALLISPVDGSAGRMNRRLNLWWRENAHDVDATLSRRWRVEWLRIRTAADAGVPPVLIDSCHAYASHWDAMSEVVEMGGTEHMGNTLVNCELAWIVKKSKKPKVSFLENLEMSRELLRFLPFELYKARRITSEEGRCFSIAACMKARSWSHDDIVGLVNRELAIYFSAFHSADYDNDGVADLLLKVQHGVPRGESRVFGVVLTRNSPMAPLRLVRVFEAPEGRIIEHDWWSQLK